MHKHNGGDDSVCCTVSFQIKHRKRGENCSKASYHMFYNPKLKWNIQQRHLGMRSQLRQPHSPISPHVIKPLLLPPAPGQSSWSWAPSAGKRFSQARFDLFSIWLTLLWTCPMRFPAILALLSQHTWTTCLLNLVPSQHASSPSAFATAPLGEWETGPSKEARVHSRHSASALPTQCGSPTDHNVRPYRECTGGHLWFAGIQMNVYGACLAAKGQALSQLLQPLSWVRSWLCGLALNWVKICGVWICDLLISLYVTTPVYYSPDNEVTVFVYVFSACLFYRNSKNHSVHLSVKWQPQFTCVVCVLAGFTIFNI